MPKILLFSLLLLLTACQEKMKPIVIKNSSLETPISCLNLNILDQEDELVKHLNQFYKFKKSCNYRLTLTYKQDIVCNSSYNVGLKSTGKFPKSFLKLEVRKGLKVLYSYYVDLYSNADSDDVEEGFLRLKNDLLLNK